MSDDRQIRFNEQAHDAVKARYESRHCEIFNQIEQQRLRQALQQAVAHIATGAGQPTALDYGCGSGNLTAHLIDLGLNTTSADVSQGFLDMIEKKFAASGLSTTIKVNGADLSNIADDAFDLVATYSVLHHVPDYPAIVAEMCRITKPGGVLYIDHEVNESYYDRPAEYVEFLKAAKPRIDVKRCLRLLLDVPGYIHVIRRLLNPRYRREGDIHVFADDHIEWPRIRRLLEQHHFQVVVQQDYLLCKSRYDPDVYQRYSGRCADERLMIAVKEPAASERT